MITTERIDKVYGYVRFMHDAINLGMIVHPQRLAMQYKVAKHVPMVMSDKKIIINGKDGWEWASIEPNKQMAKAIIGAANDYAAKSMRKSRGQIPNGNKERVYLSTYKKKQILKRIEDGESQSDLAIEHNISQSSIAKWKAGERLGTHGKVRNPNPKPRHRTKPVKKLKTFSFLWGLIKFNY